MSNKRARIADSNPFTATDGVLAGYEQANKLASQQVDQSTSHQAEKSTSQEVSEQLDRSNSLLSAPAIVAPPRSTIEDDGNLGKSTSQQVRKSTSEEVDLLELEDRSSQQPSQSVQPRSQQADKLASQQVSKPILRKATYQIDAVVLEALDRYQLQLQIDLGRRNAPHKETIVEEAIVQWLEWTAKFPDRAVKSLGKRQELR